MSRAMTIRNVLDKKHETIALGGEWGKAFGQPEFSGIWLIYGKDKNGKTWMSLKLSDVLSAFDRVLYVSAEEGIEYAFQQTLLRVGIGVDNKMLNVIEYEPISELIERLSKRRSPKVIFLDNLTIYSDELKGKALNELKQRFPDKLFVCVAHEERNEPFTAAAKMARKLAKIIIQVKGLTCYIQGRCPGGIMTIDESKSMLYWGTGINNKED